MEIQTSSQAYELYRKLADREIRLGKQNRGFNLLSKNEKKEWFITILKKTRLNLREKEENIGIDTNLFYFSSCSWDGNVFNNFLKKLKEELSVPCYEFHIKLNRREKNKFEFGYYSLFREKDFDFEDIKISIGEQAQVEIDKLPYNLIEEIEKIIKGKRNLTLQDEKDFERYSYLSNRIGDLKRQYRCENQDNRGYDSPAERTILISITPEEYNQKLQEVETEITALCKKYPFLKMPSISYIKILTADAFDEWKKKHEEQAREDWNSNDDLVDKESYDNNYDDYLNACYEMFLENGEDEEEIESEDEEESDEDDEGY